MNFTTFKFGNELQEGLDIMGFEKATPVQEQAIPIIQNGKDLIACAQTGTGKTAAFVLPILDKLTKVKQTNKVKAIIVDKLGVDESEVTNEANFTNDLGADSLDTVELIMEFEKEFDIQIPDDKAEAIETVSDAISFIKAA